MVRERYSVRFQHSGACILLNNVLKADLQVPTAGPGPGFGGPGVAAISVLPFLCSTRSFPRGIFHFLRGRGLQTPPSGSLPELHKLEHVHHEQAKGEHLVCWSRSFDATNRRRAGGLPASRIDPLELLSRGLELSSAGRLLLRSHWGVVGSWGWGWAAVHGAAACCVPTMMDSTRGRGEDGAPAALACHPCMACTHACPMGSVEGRGSVAMAMLLHE